MASPWRNWFHCTGNTYGTWLRGDPRGWRARHHREHVDGDYRTPPPRGAHEREHRTSLRLLKHEPVLLSPEQRRIGCLALAEALLFHEVELVELCVSASHFHALCRFTPWNDPPQPQTSPRGGVRGLSRDEGTTSRAGSGRTENRSPRRIIGLAKNWSAKKLLDHGGLPHRKVWAKRSLTLPIANRSHQLRVIRYIRAHEEKETAAVWSTIRKA